MVVEQTLRNASASRALWLGLLDGLVGLQSTLRQELEHAGARPATSDAIEKLGEILEGVHPAQDAVHRESQQRGIARTGLRSANEEAVLSHERDRPQQTLDVSVRDGQDPVVEKRCESRLLALEKWSVALPSGLLASPVELSLRTSSRSAAQPTAAPSGAFGRSGV